MLHPSTNPLTSLTIFAAKYLIALLPLMLCVVFFLSKGAERFLLAKRGILVGLLAIAFVKFGGRLLNDPRPFVVDHFTPLVPHAADNGFPSDHTLLAFVCAFLMLAQKTNRLAIVALLLALCVGIGRIACGLHHSTDILGSILYAALSVVLAIALFRLPTKPETDEVNASL